jgi:hypothetical protein
MEELVNISLRKCYALPRFFLSPKCGELFIIQTLTDT